MTYGSTPYVGIAQGKIGGHINKSAQNDTLEMSVLD